MNKKAFLYVLKKSGSLRVIEGSVEVTVSAGNVTFFEDDWSSEKTICSREEGEVYRNVLWLSERNRMKAIDQFISYKQELLRRAEIQAKNLKDDIGFLETIQERIKED